MDNQEPGKLVWIALAAGTVVMLAMLAAAGRWPLTDTGQVVITDFATVWAAAVRTLQGVPALAYDHALHEAYYAQLIDRPAANGLTFGYPPTAFAVIAPLGLLPYGPALLVYLAIGLTLWFIVLRAITRDSVTALAMTIAFGGAAQTLLLAQNGFLTAAALAGGLALLPRRPLIAGVLFGLLAIKPHLGLALAPFLLLRGDWRAIGAAAATLAGTVLLSVLAWGPTIWTDYLAASREIADILSGRADTVIGGKMQSVFALAAGHMPLDAALIVHGVFAAAVLALLAIIVRRAPPYPVQAAAVIAATVLMTPYSFLYDCTMLTAAAAFLLTQPLARQHRLAVLVALALPGLWFFIAQPLVPLTGLIVLLICLRGPATGDKAQLRPLHAPLPAT